MTVPAYVLAGGRSRRMGRDKASLRLKGRDLPMAAQVASVMAQAGCQPVSIVGRQVTLRQLGWPVIPDPAGVDHHPLWGMVAALEHAQRLGLTSIVVAPCDLPDLDAGTITALVSTCPPVVAESDRELQPLLAHVPVGWLERVRDFAAQGTSVRRLWTTSPAPVARIEVASTIAQDLDSPADVDHWSQRWRRER